MKTLYKKFLFVLAMLILVGTHRLLMEIGNMSLFRIS